MKILHKYLLTHFLRTLTICILISTLLFVIFDFFDRIDNIVGEEASLGTTISYFLYKIPTTLYNTLPISVLVATLFSVGLLAKNSEFTCMRLSGVSVLWLARPILIAGLVLSLVSIVFNETLVPHSARRAREIYNIDIRKKDQTGAYSQNDFWWRSGDKFYSISNFDSRENELHDLSAFVLDSEFAIMERSDAKSVQWLDPLLGWSMSDVDIYKFSPQDDVERLSHKDRLPLPISEDPKYFYDAKLEVDAMGYMALRNHMKKLNQDGVSTRNYNADLYAKLAFPFINFIAILSALPFALKPARSGKMASSFVAGLTIGFTYYVVHSFSVALGRAELMPAFLSAWMANILLGFVGLVLNWGAEAP